MTGEFCGNPFNHDAHSKERQDGTSFWCEGVGRIAVEEAVVEKFEPSIQAEDGTEYSEITIKIEDRRGISIITVPRASFIRGSAKSDSTIPLDRSSINFYPEVEEMTLKFKPYTIGDGPAVTIERIVKDVPSA